MSSLSMYCQETALQIKITRIPGLQGHSQHSLDAAGCFLS